MVSVSGKFPASKGLESVMFDGGGGWGAPGPEIIPQTNFFSPLFSLL